MKQMIKLWNEQGNCGILYPDKEGLLCGNLKFI